jgi:hypothetical protein
MALFRINKNIHPDDLIYYYSPDGPLRLEVESMVAALEFCNCEVRKEYEFNKNRPVSLINNIPRKSLSGALGECFGVSLSIFMGGVIAKNMHESSGPDMVPHIPETQEWTQGLKKDFCPFGGFDMKGSLTTGMHFMKVKPSSHHDQTTQVLTVQWISTDYTCAEIIGLYYTRYLEKSDWKISRIPKNPDAKLTSNARLLSSGMEKVRKGWVAIRDDVVLPKNKDLFQIYSLNDYCLLDSELAFRASAYIRR